MTRKPTHLTPWQQMEEQAYHAYREWPVFLKRRLHALRQHLPPEAFVQDGVTPPENTDTEDDIAADIALLKEYGLLVPTDATNE